MVAKFLSKLLVIIVVFGLLVGATQEIQAKIGVGVGTGKIILDETIKSGTIYSLPSFTVLNTGDETATYGVGISQREAQMELEPKLDWFSFTPETFTLEPGQAKEVSVSLQIPLRTRPGEYFAFVEAHPIVTATSGSSVNIAAASKLYFEVKAESLAISLYYRLYSLWQQHKTLISIALISILVILTALLVSKHFQFSVARKR